MVAIDDAKSLLQYATCALTVLTDLIQAGYIWSADIVLLLHGRFLFLVVADAVGRLVER